MASSGTARIEVNVSDKVLDLYTRGLQLLSDKDAKLVFVRAIKRGGQQGYTAVKRALSKELGASYRKIPGFVKDTPAPSFDNLAFTITAQGGETNLQLFNAVKRKKGISAAPWRGRKVHKGTFFIGKNVYARTSKARGPVKQIWGPNIARETEKPYVSRPFILIAPPAIARELEHQLAFRLRQLGM